MATHIVLPWVHRVIPNLKTWALSSDPAWQKYYVLQNILSRNPSSFKSWGFHLMLA